jgi:GT2 family glycosyltransferase
MDGGGASAHHVAVVVLSWNGRDDAIACLEGLGRSRWWGDLTVVLVDNGSTDGTAEAVRARFPEAVVIANERNLGFAEGNNVGIRNALALGADHVLVLNNDVDVDPGMIAELVRASSRLPDAGIVCPIVYYADPPDLVWYAGARFDPRRGHNGRQEGYRERDRGQFDEVRTTERATGAAMLVSRAVLEEVGLFDPALFLHVEDADFSLRVRATGRRIYVVPQARAWHKVSVDSGGENSPLLAYYAMRNTLAVCERHAPLTGWPAAARHAETVLAQVAHVRRSARPLANLRAAAEGWRDWRRGRLGSRAEAVR